MREATAALARTSLPVMLAATGVLAVIGPFGTFQDLALPARFAYWGGLLLLGTAAFRLLAAVAGRVIRGHGIAGPVVLVPVTLATNGLMTLGAATFEAALRGHDIDVIGGWPALYLYALAITVPVTGLAVWLELRRSPPAAPPPPATGPDAAAGTPQPAGPIAFLDRVPPRLGRALLALEMEDHYVRVHTDQGSDLILMRLRDAVAELQGLDGLQVHRSYWVAAQAVAGVERKPDGKAVLLLSNGMRVPVSRSHAAAVRAAGWMSTAPSRP